MKETRLTIRSRGGHVFSVEANGKKMMRPLAVSFEADANKDFITAQITFGVDVVDLIDSTEAIADRMEEGDSATPEPV